MPKADPQLVGWWKIQSLEMPRNKSLQLLEGRPGDCVCFSKSGVFNIFPNDDDIQRYRCQIKKPYRELDVWIQDLEGLTTRCL